MNRKDNQLSAISYQLSAISYQLSAISYQLSAISYQLSGVLTFSVYNTLWDCFKKRPTNRDGNVVTQTISLFGGLFCV
jgi:hypothetical protein